MWRAGILAALFFGWSAIAHADLYDGLRAFDTGDYVAAASEWRAAADQGDAQAQFRLARLYEEGLGVPQNFTEAHRWYNLAASRGHAEARDAREALAERMTPDQVAAAQRLAAEWQPISQEAEAEVTGTEQPAPIEMLLAAAAGGEIGAVKAALAQGAEVSAPTAEGWTALMVAAAAGHEAVVEALLEAGAEINVESEDGATPLLLAIFGGHEDVATALVEHGADVTILAPDGQTALAMAEARGLEELAKRLGAFAPATPEALFKAAEAGELERVRALLEQGVEINAADEDGWTALMFAIAGSHPELVEALVQAGAEVNVTAEAGDVSGWTPLMFAAATGNERIVQELLDAGAEPAAENAQGVTARAIANQKGHEELGRRLSITSPEVAEERLGLSWQQRQTIQRALTALGHEVGEPDGVFGPRTRRALMAYQQAQGNAATGYLTAMQVERLLQEGERSPPRQVATEPRRAEAERRRQAELEEQRKREEAEAEERRQAALAEQRHQAELEEQREREEAEAEKRRQAALTEQTAAPRKTQTIDLSQAVNLNQCEAFVNDFYAEDLRTNANRFQLCVRNRDNTVPLGESDCNDPVWNRTTGPERCRPFVKYACEIYERKSEFLAKCQEALARR